MKQTLLLIFIYIFSFQLLAQVSLVLSTNPTSAIGSKDLDQIIAKAMIKNESSEKKVIIWERNILSLSEGWETAVCDKNLCYIPSVSTSEFELEPMEEAVINVYGYPEGLEGAASVEVKLTDSVDPTNTVTGQFNIRSEGFTTSTHFVTKRDIKIYPNPTTQYISLTDARHINRLVVYNIVGRPVKTFKTTYDNQYDVSSLPVGMYLVRLMDRNDKTVKTVRLSLNYP